MKGKLSRVMIGVWCVNESLTTRKFLITTCACVFFFFRHFLCPAVTSIHDRHMYTLAGKLKQYVSVLMMMAMTRSDCVAVLLLFTRPELQLTARTTKTRETAAPK